MALIALVGSQGLRQQWGRVAMKIDSLSLRERAIIFAALAVLLFTVVNDWVLDPEFAKQKQLSEQIKGNQQRMEQIQAEIRQTIKVQSDPDEEGRARLVALKRQTGQMNAELLEMQKGLVSPDKMTTLLEDILKRNGNLRMVSLKTLPVASLGAAANAGSSMPEANKAPVGVTPERSDGGRDKVKTDASPTLVYTHGVEIVVQGSYLDMMNYMLALEGMPWQLFWGKARLDVTSYPDARLALTVYTLSLDKKWLNL